MVRTTPERIRTLQRKRYAKAKQETVHCCVLNSRVCRRDILSRAGKHRTGKGACLGVKNIGKPCAGKLHARFDEGGQDFRLWIPLHGHEAGNGGHSQGLAYRRLNLFSTLPPITRQCSPHINTPIDAHVGSVLRSQSYVTLSEYWVEHARADPPLRTRRRSQLAA